MKRRTRFEMALDSTMHSRFVARADDLGRSLTTDEVREEAKYLLETIPYSGMEEIELTVIMRELRRLAK